MQICKAATTLEAVTAGNVLGHALVNVRDPASYTVLAKAGTQHEHRHFWYPFAHHLKAAHSMYVIAACCC